MPKTKKIQKMPKLPRYGLTVVFGPKIDTNYLSLLDDYRQLLDDYNRQLGNPCTGDEELILAEKARLTEKQFRNCMKKGRTRLLLILYERSCNKARSQLRLTVQ